MTIRSGFYHKNMRHLTFDHKTPIIDTAIDFAYKAHANQRRKYTGTPYIEHPLAIARILFHHGASVAQVCAGVLHDTVEDCDVTLDDICDNFGPVVRDLVSDLTDVSRPEDGNRAARKEIDRQHTAAASPAAKTVKCVDIFHNTNDIVIHDPDFAVVYLHEIGKTLPFLQDADHLGLFQMAYDSWHTGSEILSILRTNKQLAEHMIKA